MSKRQTISLADRLVAVGCSSSLASQLQREVSRWISGSGLEWTVSRLKRLKNNYLRYLAGQGQNWDGIATKAIPETPTFRKPKGPFGALWARSDQFKSRIRALNALMIYSSFIAKEELPEQWSKFHDSATRPAPNREDDPGLEDLIVPRFLRVNLKGDKAEGANAFLDYVAKKGYLPDYVARHVSEFIDSDIGQALWEKYPRYAEVMGAWAPRIQSRFDFDDYLGYHEPITVSRSKDPVGVLGTTQEPGLKLRVFAAPNIVHQTAMLRLQRHLFDLLRKVNWDCTYDQSVGTDWAEAHLGQGETLYCVDLSDATNNFPLDLQLKLLRKVGCLEEDINLFHDLSRANWRPLSGKPIVRWSVGQPLGLGPSFAAFALTHGVIVYTLARKVGLSHRDAMDHFRILGDDVIIRGERLGNAYMDYLTAMDIPISKDKTLVSNQVAEFAGKTITLDGIISAVKWRNPSDDSFMDFVRNVGPAGIPFLQRKQREVVEFLGPLPTPIGLEWNPRGIPFSTRLQVCQLLEEIREKAPLLRYVNRDSYSRSLDRSWNESYLEPSYGIVRHGILAVAGATEGPGLRRPGVALGINPGLLAKVNSGLPKFQIASEHLRPADYVFLRKSGYINAYRGKKRNSTRETLLESSLSLMRHIRTAAADLGYHTPKNAVGSTDSSADTGKAPDQRGH